MELSSYTTLDTTKTIHKLEIIPFDLEIVAPSSGIQFYKDRIVFLSVSKNERKMSSKQISFGSVEAYTANISDSLSENHRIFSSSSPFYYPCEAISFSQYCDTVYFTMKARRKKKEQIFMARLETNNRNLPVVKTEKLPLDFCDEDYNYSHPALSYNGKMMVFASDKEGSLGGMDLWVVKKSGDTWSNPVNLGPNINTPGNEFFPFLDKENNLYFSSDLLPGLGGYDIFSCRFNGKGWDKPENMSDQINSPFDDVAFTINRTDEQTAFFTRRSLTGKPFSQLYRIIVSQKQVVVNSNSIPTLLNKDAFLVASENAGAAGRIQNVLKTDELGVYQPKDTVKKSEKPKPGDRQKTVAKTDTKETAVSQTKTPVKQEPVSKQAVKPATQPANKPANQAANQAVNQVAGQAKNLSENQKTNQVSNQPVTPSVNQPVNKPVAVTNQPAAKPAEEQTPVKKGSVVFKVQFRPTDEQIKAGVYIINGKSYKISEYIYLGAKRYTFGEFATASEAYPLQKICRQTTDPQAFVAAFKDNVRSLDPALFK